MIAKAVLFVKQCVMAMVFGVAAFIMWLRKDRI
jgi:hypothetical protein